MTDDWIVLDAEGKSLSVGDCVERKSNRYAVVGITNVANEDIVVLGELVGGRLAHPFCERADWLRKVQV